MGDSEAKKARRGAGWSENEDMSLARAYVAISHDPVVGNGQKSSAFWNRVFQEFERLVPETKRNSSGLPHRWSTLQRMISKFAGFFTKMEDKAESGKRYEDQVADALFTYQSIEGKAFRHRDIWEYLRRESPKFFDVPNSRNKPEIVDADDTVQSSLPSSPTDRPVGAKRAKLEAKQFDIEKETSAAIVSFVKEQREFMGRIANSVKQMADTQKATAVKEGETATNQRELALFTININTLDDDAKEYILSARQAFRDKSSDNQISESEQK